MHIGMHTTQFKRRDSFSECRQTPLLTASAIEFVQLVMPLHSPHATQQSSLCFLQEHLRVSQSCLHVHLTTSRRASGAGGRSVIIGSRRFRTRSQHHSSGSRSSPFPIHRYTCKYTECCGKTLLPMLEADCAAAQLC